MLPPPGPSPTTVAARKLRGTEWFAQARMRVLRRHGLTEADITNMTEDERARSTLGREIDYELFRSDWAKEWTEISTKLRTQEDENDVTARRQMVLAENASAEFPYRPKKIRLLLRRRKKDLERFSHTRYYTEMFGDPAKDRWNPSVDKQAVLKSMSAEAIHKQAFCEVEKDEQFQKAVRRQRLAQIVCDVPEYKGESFDGSFTIQCKFSQKPGRSVTVALVAEELDKAARLASRGLADNYFLFTNMQLTGTADEAIRTAFEAIPGVKRCRVYGVEQISQFIRESARLRMLVPRVYGLGDLGQILDRRAYDQAQCQQTGLRWAPFEPRSSSRGGGHFVDAAKRMLSLGLE
jgi:hypothetical protein